MIGHSGGVGEVGRSGGGEIGVGAGEEDGSPGDTGGASGAAVARVVADEPGACEVESALGGGGEDHARGGLAPGVLAGELGEGAAGVKGAEVEGVDGVVEEFVGAVVDGVNGVDGVGAAGDAALIGDDDELIAGVLEAGAEFGGAWEESDEGGIAEVAGGDDGATGDEGVVAVEEDGGRQGWWGGGHQAGGVRGSGPRVMMVVWPREREARCWLT